jgi:hypothetical protein
VRGGGVDHPLGVEYDTVALRTLARDQPRLDVEPHQFRVAFERIAPAATAPGVGDQEVAGLDLDVVEFRMQ